MKKKTYIVFYEYYNKTSNGKGFIDEIEVKNNGKLDIRSLNNYIEKKVIEKNNMDKDTKVIITNIINQETI